MRVGSEMLKVDATMRGAHRGDGAKPQAWVEALSGAAASRAERESASSRSRSGSELRDKAREKGGPVDEKKMSEASRDRQGADGLRDADGSAPRPEPVAAANVAADVDADTRGENGDGANEQQSTGMISGDDGAARAGANVAGAVDGDAAVVGAGELLSAVRGGGAKPQALTGSGGGGDAGVEGEVAATDATPTAGKMGAGTSQENAASAANGIGSANANQAGQAQAGEKAVAGKGGPGVEAVANQALDAGNTSATLGAATALGGSNHAGANLAAALPGFAEMAQSAAATQDAQMQEADAQANLATAARGLTVAARQGGGTVTLRLQPPELGVLRVQMEMAQGTVRASFTTQHENVGSLLTQQMTQLRHALESQGLTVERLEVQVQQPTGANGGNAGQNETAGDGRSRGQFERQQSGDNWRDEPSRGQAPASFRELLDTLA